MTLLEAFSVFAMIVFSSYIILVLLSISHEVPYTISLLVLSHEYHGTPYGRVATVIST